MRDYRRATPQSCSNPKRRLRCKTESALQHACRKLTSQPVGTGSAERFTLTLRGHGLKGVIRLEVSTRFFRYRPPVRWVGCRGRAQPWRVRPLSFAGRLVATSIRSAKYL